MIINTDCLTALREMPDASVDSIVTDPPYGLSNTDPAHVVEALTRWAEGDREFIPTGKGFMGKAWDAFVPPPAVWDECMRILKPGGHLLAFAGSRTFDLMTLSIRFAGFDIRDSIAWLYGSGFPKSLNVGKALPEWEGWGTALKPAFEPVVVARKPLIGTVAANVLAHGTGALNIDASRIGTDSTMRPNGPIGYHGGGSGGSGGSESGRFPANVILDESQAEALDEQSGQLTSGKVKLGGFSGNYAAAVYGKYARNEIREETVYGDTGGASRFFYVAKAPKSERPVVDGVAHPTVKPLALMRYLVKLVTPPEGVVVDPFAGSGTTLEAAKIEGFDYIGIEASEDYIPLIEARLNR